MLEGTGLAVRPQEIAQYVGCKAPQPALLTVNEPLAPWDSLTLVCV